ncbi:MAG: hypothetical protein V4677_07520 [Bacteroidota bacterium]
MKNIFEKLGKTGTAISVFLGIVAAVITCWQAYKIYSRHNIAGAWKLKFVVVSSSYKAYEGDIHTQRVSFCQNECEISGDGEKWEYNGELLDFDKHRKLEYKGALDDDCLKATYKLFGKLRESSGDIVVTLSEDGKKMKGTFIGTAADSRGTVEGERID